MKGEWLWANEALTRETFAGGPLCPMAIGSAIVPDTSFGTAACMSASTRTRGRMRALFCRNFTRAQD